MLGCQNTPAKSSRFCNEHLDLASRVLDDSLLMGDEKDKEEIEDCGDEVLPIRVLNDKKTRNGKFFQVASYFCVMASTVFVFQTVFSNEYMSRA